MPESSAEITALLAEVGAGNAGAIDAIMPHIYRDLQERAHRYLQSERGNHTLNTTALVHEAYLRLVGQSDVNWKNRAHFFGIASIVMRRILINYAKKKKAAKRGGGDVVVTLFEDFIVKDARSDMLLELDEAMERLTELNDRHGKSSRCASLAGSNTTRSLPCWACRCRPCVVTGA